LILLEDISGLTISSSKVVIRISARVGPKGDPIGSLIEKGVFLQESKSSFFSVRFLIVVIMRLSLYDFALDVKLPTSKRQIAV
jgi:hypothetical protein